MDDYKTVDSVRQSPTTWIQDSWRERPKGKESAQGKHGVLPRPVIARGSPQVRLRLLHVLPFPGVIVVENRAWEGALNSCNLLNMKLSCLFQASLHHAPAEAESCTLPRRAYCSPLTLTKRALEVMTFGYKTQPRSTMSLTMTALYMPKTKSIMIQTS